MTILEKEFILMKSALWQHLKECVCVFNLAVHVVTVVLVVVQSLLKPLSSLYNTATLPLSNLFLRLKSPPVAWQPHNDDNKSLHLDLAKK